MSRERLTRRSFLTVASSLILSYEMGKRAAANSQETDIEIQPPPEKIKKTVSPITLMYHDINFPRAGNSEEEANWDPPERFRLQFEQLRNLGYKMGTVSEAMASPSKVVALTFDDGIHTAYEFIFPVLKNKGVNATLFVPVDALLKKNEYFLTKEQLKEMSDYGFEVGSHSVNHVPLTSLSIEDARIQLKVSKATLEDFLGKEVKFYAYPNGKHNPQLAKEVRDAGYDAAFIARLNTGLNLEPPLDRFELPRYHITGKTNISVDKTAKNLVIYP